ncbi:MAG TPA: hypothetical protein VGI30_05305 [Caulobacteraceae bacterium]|jgi:hypothetical protein
MGAARNTVPKWADPDLPWYDAEPSAASEEPTLKAVVDRFHNHEEMSPEAMASAIAELREALKSLDGRLTGTESEAADATQARKSLGASMVQMGDALSRRVRSLEDAAEVEARRAAEREKAEAVARKAAKARMLRLSLGAGVAVVLIVAAVMLLVPHGPQPPQPMLYSPAAAGSGG